MVATPAQLHARLDALGIRHQTHSHPPVATVEANRQHRGDLAGAHTKNLFLKDKKGVLWLVVCLENRTIDLKDLRRRLGAAALSFARPALLMEVLGVEPGSVTPFALINDAQGRVRVVLDQEMLAMEPLNFHPLTNTATTQIAAADLRVFLAATGHRPIILPLSGLPA
jgi:Ala-tRNA(Pro) deacylase